MDKACRNFECYVEGEGVLSHIVEFLKGFTQLLWHFPAHRTATPLLNLNTEH